MKNIDIVVPVYNKSIQDLTASLNNQIIPADWNVNCFFIDDGSEKLISPPKETGDISFVLQRLDDNYGCSFARNYGVNSGSSEFIIFVDSDCFFSSNLSVSRIVKNLDRFDVCFVRLKSIAGGFWSIYQNEVFANRKKLFFNGLLHVFTSACFVVRREKYELVGGFDCNYYFGFEDRDLFIQLIKNKCKIGYDDEIVVIHNDDLTLDDLCRKSFLAGKESSIVFKEKCYSEYCKTNYSRIDFSEAGLIYKLFFIFMRNRIKSIIVMTEFFLKKEKIVPYFILKYAVKMCSAMAYTNGTYVRDNASK